MLDNVLNVVPELKTFANLDLKVNSVLAAEVWDCGETRQHLIRS